MGESKALFARAVLACVAADLRVGMHVLDLRSTLAVSGMDVLYRTTLCMRMCFVGGAARD